MPPYLFKTLSYASFPFQYFVLCLLTFSRLCSMSCSCQDLSPASPNLFLSISFSQIFPSASTLEISLAVPVQVCSINQRWAGAFFFLSRFCYLHKGHLRVAQQRCLKITNCAVRATAPSHPPFFRCPIPFKKNFQKMTNECPFPPASLPLLAVN